MLKLKLILIIVKLLACVATASGQNFVVVTPTPHKDRYVKAAETSYKSISKFWFGKPHPDLARPVSISVQERTGTVSGGGATSFSFDRGHVFGWRMTVVGTPEQIEKSVIPHEVNHVVFAAHFRRPIPRFFDEGAASLMETEADRRTYEAKVAGTRPPPLKTAIDRTRYPLSGRMVQTFYAHAHVVCRYLVETQGPDKFVAFLEDKRKPSEKLKQFYGMTPDELEVAAFKPRKTGREVIVLSTPNCAPCDLFDGHRQAGHFAGYSFRIVKTGDKDFAAQAAAFRKATGKTPDRYPTFWVVGSKTYTVGYSGPRSLLEWLVSIPAGLFRLVFGDQQSAAGPAGPTFQDGTQPVSADVDLFGRDDWSGVRIFVLAAVQDVGVVRGQARAALIGLSRGPLERKIAELTKGKARVYLVAERLEPKKYDAVLKALGREPSAFNVAVIVPKTNQGLIKGLVLRKVEAIGERKLANAPVDVLFERIDGVVVAAVDAAMQIQDAPASVPLPKDGDGPPQPGVETFQGELKSFIKEQFKANVPAGPLPEKIQDAIADKAAEKVVEKLPLDLIPNWLLAALIGTGGVGYSIREFIRHRFDKKQEAKAEKQSVIEETKTSVLQLLASSLLNSSEAPSAQPVAQRPSSTVPAQPSSSSGPSVPASEPNASAVGAIVSTTVV